MPWCHCSLLWLVCSISKETLKFGAMANQSHWSSENKVCKIESLWIHDKAELLTKVIPSSAQWSGNQTNHADCTWLPGSQRCYPKANCSELRYYHEQLNSVHEIMYQGPLFHITQAIKCWEGMRWQIETHHTEVRPYSPPCSYYCDKCFYWDTVHQQLTHYASARHNTAHMLHGNNKINLKSALTVSVGHSFKLCLWDLARSSDSGIVAGDFVRRGTLLINLLAFLCNRTTSTHMGRRGHRSCLANRQLINRVEFLKKLIQQSYWKMLLSIHRHCRLPVSITLCRIFGCACQPIHIHVSMPVISCKSPLYISLFSALCSETLIDLPMNGKEEKTSIALTAPQQSRDLQSSSIPSNRTAGTEKQELDRNSSPMHKCLKIALLSLVAVIGVLVLLLPSIAYYLPLPSVSFFFILSLNVLYI